MRHMRRAHYSCPSRDEINELNRLLRIVICGQRRQPPNSLLQSPPRGCLGYSLQFVGDGNP
jgi:hypothetical protein